MYGDKFSHLPTGHFCQLETIDDILFTSREVDVIACIVHMRGSSKIASILNISPRTAETHISNIKRKIAHSAREGVIDFIERSGKLFIVRKHYQALLVRADFNKRLKAISMLVRNHAPNCHFLYPEEKSERSIIFEIQNHLKGAGVKLTSHVLEQGAPVEHKQGDQFIYVISGLLVDQLQAKPREQELVVLGSIEHPAQAPGNCTFLLLDNIKGEPPREIAEVGYISFLEQDNYYFAIFEMLKRILPDVSLDNIIFGFKAYHQSIHTESGRSVLLSELDAEAATGNNIKAYIVSKLFKNRKWLIIAIVSVITVLIIFQYSFHQKNPEVRRQCKEPSSTPSPVRSQLVSYIPEILTSYEEFIGRHKELQQIDRALGKDNIVVVTGHPGVGKSSCVVEYGKLHRQNKIIRYFNADSVAKIDQKYRGLAQELNIDVSKYPQDVIIQLVNNKVSSLEIGIIFIFDNVDQYDEVKAYLVNLPPNVKALVTTRRSKLIANKEHIALNEFTDKEAEQYLQNGLQNRNLSQNSMKELIKNTGTLPYDLRCSVAYLLDNPLVDTKAVIREIGSKIKNKLFEQFAISKDKEKQQAWKILQYVAHLDPDSISIEILKELFPQNEFLLSRAVKKLESLSLISMITDKSDNIVFNVHRNLQNTVLSTSKYYPKYSMAEQEIQNNLLIKLDKLFLGFGRNPDVKRQKATSLQPHIKKLLDSACQATSNKAKVSQANLYYKLARYYFMVSVNFEAALKYAKISLRQRRKIPGGDYAAIADSLDLTGQIYSLSGNAQEGLTYLIEGLRIRRGLYKGDHPDIAFSLMNIGYAYRLLGMPRETKEHAKTALQMEQRLYSGDHLSVASSLNVVGVAHLHMGEFKEALEYFKASLKMHQDLGNNAGVAMVLNGVAYSSYQLGDYLSALRDAKASVAMCEELYPGEYLNSVIVFSLRTLGAVLIATNDEEQGLKTLRRALSIGQQLKLDKHFIMASIFYELQQGYLKIGKYQKALEYGDKALNLKKELYLKVKDHREIAKSLHRLGDTYKALGNKTRALELYKEALAMNFALSLDKHIETREITQKIQELGYPEG